MSRFDFSARSGDTIEVPFFVLTQDDATPVGDITGYSVAWNLYARRNGTLLYTFSGSITDAATAECLLFVVPSLVETIAVGTYWYEIKVSCVSDGRTPLEGIFRKAS